MDYRDNLEVDIIDLLHQILKKWRILLIWMVIGAVALGAYGYMNSAVQINEDTGEEVEEVPKTDIVSIKEKLSLEQIAVAENAAEQYLTYLREYNGLVNYQDKSIFLNLDSHNVSRIKATYIIDDYAEDDLVISDEVDSTDSKWVGMLKKKLLTETNNIVALYRNELVNNENIEKIKAECGLDVNSGSIAELIGVGIEGDNILYINVYGKDEAMCNDIMDIIQDSLNTATEQVKKTYNYNITPVDRYYLVVNDGSIFNTQKDYYSYLYTLRYNRSTIANLLPTDCKEYYLAVTNILDAYARTGVNDDGIEGVHEFIEGYIESYSDNKSFEETDMVVETASVRRLNKKFIFVGLFAGLFAAALWYAAIYVLSSKLHSSDDMRDAFRVTVLGEMDTVGNLKGFDKLISKLFGDDKLLPEDEQLKLISLGIIIGAEKTDVSKIQLVGVSDDAISENACLKIKDSLSKADGLTVGCGKSVIRNSDSIKALADSDAAVLIEKVGASSYADIARELDMCSKYGVKVLGAVVLK